MHGGAWADLSMDPLSLPQYFEADAIPGQVPRRAQLHRDAALQEMGFPVKDPIQHHPFPRFCLVSDKRTAWLAGGRGFSVPFGVTA